MSQVKLSTRAHADLHRLYQFLADKDPTVAVRAIDAIEESFLPLSAMPKIGGPVTQELRELVIEFGNSGYVALYHVDETLDVVVILAIRHQLEKDYR